LEAEKLKESVEVLEKDKKAAEEEILKLKASLEQLGSEVETLRKGHEEMKGKAEASAEEKRSLEVRVAELRSSFGSEKRRADSFAMELQEAIRSGRVIAGLYADIVSGLGGHFSPLAPNSGLPDILKWLRNGIARLPEVVYGVSDYSALSGVVSLAGALEGLGCSHLEEVKKKKEFEAPKEPYPSEATKSLAKRFFGRFWSKFGRAHATSLAESQRAEVGYGVACSCGLFPLVFVSYTHFLFFLL
jgi:hypothetical protein